MDLVTLTAAGLYCPAGDFHIDPARPVDRAVITHAHADHATPGHGAVLCSAEGAGVTRLRVGAGPRLETLQWGEHRQIGAARVSLHPAGHILGSAQVRIEVGGEVWVASGDYKVEADDTCAPFEPVRADTFISESTFGLPVYRWPPQRAVVADIAAWWQANQQEQRASVLFVYALGKAQRILAGLAALLGADCGPVVIHGALGPLTDAYRAAGVRLPATALVSSLPKDFPWQQALVLAPPSAQGTVWLRRFGAYADAYASGWMLVRGQRRRRSVDRGFVLSDHADWPGLLQAIAATGAPRVLVTHGQVPVLVRWLQEHGREAGALEAGYGGEQEQEAATAPGDGGPSAGALAEEDPVLAGPVAPAGPGGAAASAGDPP